MAVVFNASTGLPGGGGGSANGGVSALSTTFTTISGADRFAIVILYTEGSGLSNHAVTMGAQSMGAPNIVQGDDGEFRVYTLLNCPVNQASLNATWTGTSSRCVLSGVVYTGVDQTTPFRDSDAIRVENETSIALTMTSLVNDLIVDIAIDGWSEISNDPAQTRRITMNDFGSVFRSLGVSEKAGAAGSTGVSWTAPDTTTLFLAAFSLVPSAGGGPVLGTVTPAPAQMTVGGRFPLLNPFTNVRFSEVLINEAGSPVANRTGLHLLVYYDGVPFGAPDLSYSNASTGAAGTWSYSIASGPLLYNQPVFFILTDGSGPNSLSAYTCGRVVPLYTL